MSAPSLLSSVKTANLFGIVIQYSYPLSRTDGNVASLRPFPSQNYAPHRPIITDLDLAYHPNIRHSTWIGILNEIDLIFLFTVGALLCLFAIPLFAEKTYSLSSGFFFPQFHSDYLF